MRQTLASLVLSWFWRRGVTCLSTMHQFHNHGSLTDRLVHGDLATDSLWLPACLPCCLAHSSADQFSVLVVAPGVLPESRHTVIVSRVLHIQVVLSTMLLSCRQLETSTMQTCSICFQLVLHQYNMLGFRTCQSRTMHAYCAWQAYLL